MEKVGDYNYLELLALKEPLVNGLANILDKVVLDAIMYNMEKIMAKKEDLFRRILQVGV